MGDRSFPALRAEKFSRKFMTTTESALAVSGLGKLDITVSPEADQKKADALELAKTIKTVSNKQEQQDEIACASLIKALINGMEKTRKEVKQPVLDAGRMIDDIAKIYSGTLIRELERIEKLSSAFQEQENKRLEAIRQEQERLNREAAEAAEAERRAYVKMMEAERIKAQSTGDTTALTAIQIAADEAAERNAEEARARQQALVAVAPANAEGARVVTGWEFEVTDIHVLYKAMPHLVQLEPRKALIKAALELCNGSIPGIRAWQATKVQSKAATL